MEARIYRSLKEIEPSAWNSVVRKDNIISSWEHLIAVEESHINDCEYQYLILFDQDKPVGNACYYYISFDLDIFNRGPAKKIIGFIRKFIWKNFLKMRVIECGTPTAIGSTINWTPGIDPALVISAVSEQMKIFAREKKVNILILRDFLDEDLEWSEKFLHFSFKRVVILPNTIMVNNWKNFEEYKSDLAQKHRDHVKKYLRRLESNGVTIRVVTEYEQYADRLLELWKNCYSHAREYQQEFLTREYFVNLSRYLKDKSRLVLFEKDNKIIGIVVVILNENVIQALFAGMDYDYVRENYLIFNIYLQTIKLGIDEGVKIIENGITTIREKMDYGFNPVPMYAYMRHLSPLLNPILSNLFVLFSESTRFEAIKSYNRRFAERVYGNGKVFIETGKKEIEARLEDLSLSGVKISLGDTFDKKNVLIRFSFSNSSANFAHESRDLSGQL